MSAPSCSAAACCSTATCSAASCSVSRCSKCLGSKKAMSLSSHVANVVAVVRQARLVLKTERSGMAMTSAAATTRLPTYVVPRERSTAPSTGPVGGTACATGGRSARSDNMEASARS